MSLGFPSPSYEPEDGPRREFIHAPFSSEHFRFLMLTRFLGHPRAAPKVVVQEGSCPAEAPRCPAPRCLGTWLLCGQGRGAGQQRHRSHTETEVGTQVLLGCRGRALGEMGGVTKKL